MEKHDKHEKTASLIIALTVVLILVLIWWVNFMTASPSEKTYECTGVIGDTIGGLTAPIIGIVSAILVYLAFQAQLEANKMQFNALNGEMQRSNKQREDFENDRLYDHFQKMIDSIRDDIKSLKFEVLFINGNMSIDYFHGNISYEGLNALDQYLLRKEAESGLSSVNPVRFSSQRYNGEGLINCFTMILESMIACGGRIISSSLNDHNRGLLLEQVENIFRYQLSDYGNRLYVVTPFPLNGVIASDVVSLRTILKIDHP